MDNLLEINKTILRQLKIWVYLVSILALAALAGLWVAWAHGSHSILNIVMVAGSATMFTTAALWWWWSIKIMRYILRSWEQDEVSIRDISLDIKQVRELVQEAINPVEDK